MLIYHVLFPLYVHTITFLIRLRLQLQRSRSGTTLEVEGLKPAAPTFAPPRSTHTPQDKERGPGPTYAMPEIHTGNLSCQPAHESPG